MSKAARKARKEGRGEKKVARIKKRTKASTDRTAKRSRNTTRRINSRETKGKGRIGSRLAKKLDKKGYGDLDPSDVDTVNELQQASPAMSDYLDDRGVDHDPEDPIEVGAKFTQLNPDIIDPLDDQTYDDAYVNEDDHYADVEGYENFDWKKAAKGAVKGALGSIGTSAKGYFNELKDKQNNGAPLTDAEKKLLGAVDTGKGIAKDAIKGKITDSLKNMAPFAIILLILFFVIKK